jgi:hypothetical protein
MPVTDKMSDADTASCFSEDFQTEAQPSNSTQQQGPLYTCLSCQIAFRNPADQRTHMKGDLHRYNLKRKVAGLGPVTAQVFADKLKVAQGGSSGSGSKEPGATGKKESGLSCSICR